MENKLFYKNIISYKQLLLEDFAVNNKFADIISTLFLTDSSIENWVEGIEGNSFTDYRQTLSLKWNMPTTDVINNLEYTSLYYQKYLDNIYSFFTAKEYKTYEEAVKNFPESYYCFNTSFFRTINNALLENFTDYVEVEDKNCYVKKIDTSVSIKLLPQANYNKYSGIVDLCFPMIVVEKDNIEFISSQLFDPLRFVFSYGTAFTFFTSESYTIEIDRTTNTITKMTGINDEPVIYEDNNKFIVSNSIEKLICYNKYICIVLDLYCHYFRVFEKWAATL